MKANRINKNAVSLAGEFAVLSQLSLRGFDANMTLGQTKGVDILVSDPETGRMLKLEVKTDYLGARAKGGKSKLFGNFVSAWVMNEKHERIVDPNLFYCFVNIADDTKRFRYFIVPSRVVATYVAKQHRIWLDADPRHSRTNAIRNFRIGMQGQRYALKTPLESQYEDNWNFRA